MFRLLMVILTLAGAESPNAVECPFTEVESSAYRDFELPKSNIEQLNKMTDDDLTKFYTDLVIGSTVNGYLARRHAAIRLGYVAGSAAQILRVLWWVWEPEPELRAQLATQILIHGPEDAEMASNFTKNISEQDAAMRRSDFPAQLLEKSPFVDVLKERKAKFQPRSSMDVLAPRVSDVLAQLSANDILSADRAKRLSIYEKLEFPSQMESAIVRHTDRAVLELLCLAEPDPECRKVLLAAMAGVESGARGKVQEYSGTLSEVRRIVKPWLADQFVR